MKRYVVFFPGGFEVRGQHLFSSQLPRKKNLTVRTARGPIDAYRKATGWKGKITAGKGYSPQTPAREVRAYIQWSTLDGLDVYKKALMNSHLPPTAYVVPLGEW